MARSKSERRHNEEKKYSKRLKAELSVRTTIHDDKGKLLTKPTVKDLKNIKSLKGKKNHPKSCSCSMCKKERYSRSVQKKSVIKEVEDKIIEHDTRYDYMDMDWPFSVDDEDDDL